MGDQPPANSEAPIARRDFLRLGAAGLAALALGGVLEGCSTATSTPDPQVLAQPEVKVPARPPMSASQALQELVAGNQRFAADQLTRPHRDLERRTALVDGQKPFAAVLTCSDSRLPPEILFDVGLGDIFVVRTAGNVAGRAALGSLEYAVEHLAPSLLVVLGHQKCGAVQAAVSGGEVGGHIANVVYKIYPAVDRAMGMAGDLMTNTIYTNVLATVNMLRVSEPILAEYVNSGRLEVVGARYDLDTGLIKWLVGSQAMVDLFPKSSVGDPPPPGATQP